MKQIELEDTSDFSVAAGHNKGGRSVTSVPHLGVYGVLHSDRDALCVSDRRVVRPGRRAQRKINNIRREEPPS